MALLTHPDWKSLIQHAEARSAISLPSPLENYLIQLIKRFSTEPMLGEQASALAWLNAKQALEMEGFLRIGDECLLMAGLFPERLARRSMNLNYYIQLGRSAYFALSRRTSDLYGVLAQQFVVLTDVLYYVPSTTPDLLPFEAFERFQATGSEHAKRILADYERITPFRRSF
jgi:hypothetical protein